MICILTNPGACAHLDSGHYCARALGHGGLHECECGNTWPPDREFELACRLYIAHWTVVARVPELHPDWEPPRVPERSVVEAACRPADSPWRAQARLAMAFCGVEL